MKIQSRRMVILAGTVIIVFMILLVWVRKGSGRTEHKADEEYSVQTELADHVSLVMYLIGNEPEDMDMVLEAFNQKAKKDLNCTLEIEWIGWGDFTTKYPLILSSGVQIDLIYTATWLDFYSNAGRGAFLPLEDLLPVYAPKSWKTVTGSDKVQASVNGHLYALPSGYQTYNAYGPIVRGDLMDKYNVESIDNFEEYIEFCERIAQNEEEIDPTGLCASGMELDDLYLLSKGYYPLTGSAGSAYWLDLNDENYPVYFISECPAMENYIRQAEDWYKEGLWSETVLANKDETMLESGKAASRIHNFDAWTGEYGKNPEWDLRYFNLVNPTVIQSAMQDAMAVSASSKNPEWALMLLEKLRSDESYYMLLNYGIEGVHYQLTEDGRIDILTENYGNEPGTWGFRQNKYKREDTDFPKNGNQIMEEIAESAVEIPFAHFQIDLSEISQEYAAVERAAAEYYSPLILGYIDSTQGKLNLETELQQAGNDRVKEALQKQIREFIEK